MRPRCSSGTGPRGPRTWVRTLEPGSGVDPSSERTSVAPKSYSRVQGVATCRIVASALRGTLSALRPEVPSHMTARLPFTGNDDADALIASDPLALLIGF